MVLHNYIMQMTFAFLFELIPSDVSFFYHTLHTSVSLKWHCKLLLFWSPSPFFCLPWLSYRHHQQFGLVRRWHILVTSVMSPAGWNRCTLILPSNGNTHLAPYQRTGMKNLFPQNFSQDWWAVLWHSIQQQFQFPDRFSPFGLVRQ